MQNIAVYCGSKMGALKTYEDTAREVGKLLAEKHINLVYGGGNIGMMRCVAEEVLEGKGTVTGVITHFLKDKELAHPGVTELITVETMQERKAIMADIANGFIILPGGFGTLEEFFEVLTAAQLGFHNKPICVINTNGFYNHLIHLIEDMTKNKMLLPEHASMVLFAENAHDAFHKMYQYKVPELGEWIEDIKAENRVL